MAELVAIAGVPHNPLLYRTTAGGVPDDVAAVMANYERFADRIATAGVDRLVVVGSDHFRKFTHHNSPAFVVGKAHRHATTYENEVRHFGLDEWSVAGDEEMAAWILGGPSAELPEEIDFGMTNEWTLDHGFSMPLRYLRPDWDLPVVPIHANTNIPPLPRAARFAALGGYLRTAIQSAPFKGRVALITSGHLATDIGGPKSFLGGASPDAQFDEAAVGWMRDGDLAAAIKGCTLERLLEAGNVTSQFLNFLTALAAADSRPADFAEGTANRFAPTPFFFWDQT